MTTRPPAVSRQDIGDSEIQYLDYGGDGHPLVMLHATGFLPWLWHPIARKLSATYRVIAPYFCDHRQADANAGGLGWLGLAEDLKQFCQALNLEKPFCIGHSMGATVIALAHTYHGQPAGKLVLIEPILLPRDFYREHISVNQHPLASKAVKRRNQWSTRAEVEEDFKTKKFFQTWDSEVLSLYITHGITGNDAEGFSLTCSPHREASLFMGSMQFDPWPLLPKIACPTLILEGETSENSLFIDLKMATELIPGARYFLVRGAGHLIPMEQPAETGDILMDFLR
ncbi:MAG: alpha/beta fold hydrolase [Thermodesulfobacteriota bacterium]